MSPLPQTIDEVIARMDAIIAESLETGSRLGYFAALYRKVTTEVKKNINDGTFANPELLGRLAVTFASRYFTAYDLYQQNQTPTAPWEVAFSASKRRYPIILQHLLLGMNAHINLDLAIASADTSPGIDIFKLKQDFMQINMILASQIPLVLKAINKCSPFIGLISFFYKNTEEKVTHFSLDLARAYSWLLAEDLAVADTPTKDSRIAKTITEVRELAVKLLRAKGLVKILIFIVALVESNDVRKNIRALSTI
ncbi:MAG TPA: DUF5995 family protein [Candidatus Kapabacteria bacterium]|nr:DUF5995 family protein [Candidatus Kapabacteria bacterium]